ncbi:MAG: helix-turn-helix transcriptional regulator [Clostridia bacterium]|nr:helix-turn-helix transcriptional regulator [Clostridia bacterium]
MWIIEKFVTWNFEFLSVSYILSEGMLFFLYWMMQDYVHKSDVPAPTAEKTRVIVLDSIPKAEKLERVLGRLPEGKNLTARQMEMLDGILDGKSKKEIAADLHISENTVKWHLKLLYETLNVSGKDEILALFK